MTQPYGVLILHGFTASLDCVGGVATALEALRVPIRVPVLRGHCADSPEALRNVTWHDWVADAEASLRGLLTEAERAIVVGHSMGGLAAITLAADDGEDIDSLVLAAAAIDLANPLAPGRPLHFLLPLVRRLYDTWDLPPRYADPWCAETDTTYRWAPTDAIVELFDFIVATRRRLPEVTVPTLIMQSRSDTTVLSKAAERLYRSISTPAEQKRIVWYEETDHELFLDCQREATIATIVDYVRERSGL
jgi:carboxylesterase